MKIHWMVLGVVGIGALAGVSSGVVSGCVPGLATAPSDGGAGDATVASDSGGGVDASGPVDSGDAGGQPPSEAGPSSDAAPEAGPTDSGSEAAVDAAVDAADASIPLPSVGAGHLQLWLKADVGVTCVNNQITIWADQSGNARDATNGTHSGPECPTTGHAQAGINLPFFSAPSAAAPPYNNGTLNEDLEFLNGTEFTIFVVERRWRDPGAAADEFLIGSDLPNDTATTATNCATGGGIDLLTFGYVYYDGFPALDYESVCYSPSGTRGRAADASIPPPSPMVLDMLRLWEDAGVSPTVWQDGVKINAGGAAGGPGKGLIGGSIGRAFGYTATDHRFIGDIAELIIFDVGLSDVDRATMEAYFQARWDLTY